VRVLSDDSFPREIIDGQIQRLNAVSRGILFGFRARAGQQTSGLQLRITTSSFRTARDLGTDPEAHEIVIQPDGILLVCPQLNGLRAAIATLCQLVRQYGRQIPCLKIRDWPDFARRGVMLDVSRGRVPTLPTLKQLATDLAGFKINELQLYLEHTFAYRRHRAVWRDWGALTAKEMRQLDMHCRSLGIDLVPNQNSLGHLRHWLEHAPFNRLAEVSEPYPSEDGTFLRYPSTLAPHHPGTLPFLRTLYAELLPNFSSRFFNVGCDEPWDLGLGQSKALCQRKGTGRVYVDHLVNVQREVRRHKRTMMFWGDIILNHPQLIPQLPKNVIVLNWGYEADHPFPRETREFTNAGIPFYVCPGTSSWQTLIGRNDNAFANLHAAARAGRRQAAAGYLITDWGDGGHPQPLIVSFPAFLVGAGLAWNASSKPLDSLEPVLNRELFEDPRGNAAAALLRLGEAHRLFRYEEPNATPFGATIAAPPSEQRELFCRNGLKYYARLRPQAIRAAMAEVERQRNRLARARPSRSRQVLIQEADLAARMAIASCRYLLWQQALAAGRSRDVDSFARAGRRELRAIRRDVERHWPLRNKGRASRTTDFLQWRLNDYEQRRLHYAPEEAR
jgi:hypothetical protein